jgi:hypothetical protein
LHQFGQYGVWEIVQSTKYQVQSRNTGLYKVPSTRYKVSLKRNLAIQNELVELSY